MQIGDVEGKHFYGGTLAARVTLVKRFHGEDGLIDLHHELLERGYTGPTITEDIKVKDKYPIKEFLIFLDAYRELFGEKDLMKLSRRAPQKRGIVGWFVSWSFSPEALFSKAVEYWPQFYDFGELEGKVLEEGKGRLIGKDICTVSPLLCRVLTPYFKGVFENINVENPACTHTKCEFKGDDVGEWVLTWG